MKYLFLFTIVLITQCKSMQFDTHPPFKVTKATYNNWVGGQPGVKGINVFVRYTAKQNIEFDSMYFHGRITKIEINEKKGVKFIVGRYNTATKKDNEDIILHSDSKKEVGNKIPATNTFPFELKENEAVISYQEKDKTKYYKIENIKQTKTDFYP